MVTSLVHLSGVGCVAERYGVEEAILLDSMVFWCRTNKAEGRNFNEGRWWTYNSIRGLAKIFPWWSEKQIRRIVASCKDKGALLASNFNKQGRDRTTWYSVSDELLALYGESWKDAICPNGQMHLTKRADASAQMGEPLPCNTPCSTHDIPPKAPQGGRRSREPKKEPEWCPERFAKFWTFYPRGENKQAAIRAWDKLQPSDELIDTMAQALKRQVASEDWMQGIGIPYASTWLNQRRWEDEVRSPACAQTQSGHLQEESGVYYL